MSLDIAHSIKRLLLSDHSAAVPGLGIFMLKYHSAILDKMARKISPPSKELIFNYKKDVDGSRLVDSLIDEYGLDQIAADTLINDFVSNIIKMLQYGEVDLNGLGKLRNTEGGAIEHDKSNADPIFSNAEYPVLAIEPIKREIESPTLTEQIEKLQISTESQPHRNKKNNRRFFNIIPFLLAALLFAVLAIWLFIPRSTTNNGNVELTSIDESRLNKSPQKDNTTSNQVNEDLNISEDDSMFEKQCSIIVGSFGSKVNIDNMVQTVQSHSLEFFTHKIPNSPLTRVGVKVNCHTIEKDLPSIQDKIEPNAWILE